MILRVIRKKGRYYVQRKGWFWWFTWDDSESGWCLWRWDNCAFDSKILATTRLRGLADVILGRMRRETERNCVVMQIDINAELDWF